MGRIRSQNGKIVTGKPVKEIGVLARNWVNSTHNGDYWRALENVTNLRVS